ncbi:hypothetical protein QYE76_042655 [Lolium multiflorum]|uniref:Reverse transcriptase Ty1/copia-type domain-containing protein n=1 Tax=Lolium multiflorum TaxID=4521 RepID=A0AAD8TH87_LOLMU|nr:hypothetical protein QYE76_042655 [Lolium multiflorum]
MHAGSRPSARCCGGSLCDAARVARFARPAAAAAAPVTPPASPASPGPAPAPPDLPASAPLGPPLLGPSSPGSPSRLGIPASSSSSPVPPAPVARGPRTRSQTGVFRPKKRTDGTIAWIAACVADATADPTAEPRHFQDALGIPHWRAAMEHEFQALLKNDTWRLVPPVSGVNVIDSKWVFKVKKHADGSIERYKARLVAKGFRQRMRFCMAFSRRRSICVSLQALLIQPVLSISVALLRPCMDSSRLLVRGMHDLAQFFELMGLFRPLLTPHCSFFSVLSGDFAVKDLGALHYFLGLEVSRSSAGLTLTQQKYALDLLRRAGYSISQQY